MCNKWVCENDIKCNQLRSTSSSRTAFIDHRNTELRTKNCCACVRFVAWLKSKAHRSSNKMQHMQFDTIYSTNTEPFPGIGFNDFHKTNIWECSSIVHFHFISNLLNGRYGILTFTEYYRQGSCKWNEIEINSDLHLNTCRMHSYSTFRGQKNWLVCFHS